MHGQQDDARWALMLHAGLLVPSLVSRTLYCITIIKLTRSYWHCKFSNVVFCYHNELWQPLNINSFSMTKKAVVFNKHLTVNSLSMVYLMLLCILLLKIANNLYNSTMHVPMDYGLAFQNKYFQS